MNNAYVTESERIDSFGKYTEVVEAADRLLAKGCALDTLELDTYEDYGSIRITLQGRRPETDDEYAARTVKQEAEAELRRVQAIAHAKDTLRKLGVTEL